jgi:hypothetical protein
VPFSIGPVTASEGIHDTLVTDDSIRTPDLLVAGVNATVTSARGPVGLPTAAGVGSTTSRMCQTTLR